MPRSRLTLLLLLVVVLHLLVAGWFAWQRPIDGDEGYYGLAARLVSEGETPYADFFYPQAPLLPYLYAPAAAAIGAPQLPDLRALSVLLSALTLGLVALWLHRQHGLASGPALVALLLLAFSPELLLWNTTVKTYAWVNFAVIAGLVAFERSISGDTRRKIWLAVGGICLGLAVSTRLLYAPAALVPAVWLVATRRRDYSGAAAYLGGLTLGLLPIWIALARDPAVFWFNNVAYHGLRFSELEDASMVTRVLDALKTLALAMLTSPGLLVLTALAIFGLRRSRDPALAVSASVSVSLWTAAVLAITCLVPDPVHRQYFTGALPVLLVAPAAWALTGMGRRSLVALAVAAPVLAVIGLRVIAPDLPREVHWRLDHYHDICRRIERVSDPDDVVFAFWSGYVAGTGRRPQPGMENHFGVGVSERLDRYERRRYRVIGRHEMSEIFRAEKPRVVVVGAWMNELDTALDDRRTVELLTQFKRYYQGIIDIDGVKLALRISELENRDQAP